jgi:hypothetical protein
MKKSTEERTRLAHIYRYIASRYVGKKRRNGSFTEDHILTVSNAGRDTTEKVAGLCHDIVEDGLATFDDLKQQGLNDSELYLVRLLTQRSGQKRSEYIGHIAKCEAATHLKLADIRDNFFSRGCKWRTRLLYIAEFMRLFAAQHKSTFDLFGVTTIGLFLLVTVFSAAAAQLDQQTGMFDMFLALNR